MGSCRLSGMQEPTCKEVSDVNTFSSICGDDWEAPMVCEATEATQNESLSWTLANGYGLGRRRRPRTGRPGEDLHPLTDARQLTWRLFGILGPNSPELTGTGLQGYNQPLSQ